MAFFRVLLIIVLVFFTLRIIGVLLFRFLIYKLKKKAESFNTGNNRQQPEGKVTISYFDDKVRSEKQNTGEYVDYEEIK